MDIRPLASAGPQGLDALASSAAPAPAQKAPSPAVLDPPVKLDIGTATRGTRFVRDTDTSTMVFQVVDTPSGTVLDQSPTESVLRNRAYGAAQSRAAQSGSLSRVA